MAKISTYTQVVAPSLSDILIGTDVSESNETKNFSIGDILSLAQFPAPTLDDVLNSGNTSDQDISLTGSASMSAPVIAAASLYSSVGLYVSGTLIDTNASVGTSGQLLSSTGSGVDWIDPAAIPALYTIPVLNTSYALPQNPPTVDTPLTVKFSTGIVGNINDPVMYNVGSPDVITFNEAGSYIINAFGNVYRSTNGGVSHLKFRALVNGVEAGYVKSINIDQNTFEIPYEVTIPIYVNAGTTLKFEIMRDSTGVDDGGLNRDTTSLAGWGNTPSSYIQIWQQKIA